MTDIYLQGLSRGSPSSRYIARRGVDRFVIDRAGEGGRAGFLVGGSELAEEGFDLSTLLPFLLRFRESKCR